VTGFLSMKGRKYTGQLMVVGRAVNGWTEGRSYDELRADAARLAYARHVYKSVMELRGNECPMSWVWAQWSVSVEDYNKRWGTDWKEIYNTSKSAFWRVIRAVVKSLKIADVDDSESSWPSHLVWSNLYKISPCERGNPAAKLRKAQLEGCKRLLGWELEHYRPSRVLFLTDLWADEFLSQAWEDRKEPNPQSLVRAFGRLKCGAHEATCVVACHPQGKNETTWVGEVVSAFGSVSTPLAKSTRAS